MKPMRGKWAAGISPRYFTWVIKDRIAISERPGGYSRNHRRVRRQEEVIWLREQGFDRVISLLASPHNLYAYDELGVKWAHYPFPPHADAHEVLPEIFNHLRDGLNGGERVLVHMEELGDRLMGIMAAFLLWNGMLPSAPQAIAIVEQMVQRQMGPPGRELVAIVPELPKPKS
jgi:hypothetical protein